MKNLSHQTPENTPYTTPMKKNFTTETKEVKTERAYNTYHYSDGTVKSTKTERAAGRPRLTLENGATLVKVVKYVPLPDAAAKETVEYVPGLDKKEAILVYSDGTKVTAGRGKRRQTLSNGAKLTSVLIRIPKESVKEKGSRKSTVPDEIITTESEKKTVLVYADGTEVVAGRGRPSPFRDGHALTKILRYIPEAKESTPRVAKEKKPKVIKQEKKEIEKPILTIPTSIPASIEVGKVYIHASNGGKVKVLELKEEGKIYGETILEGQTVRGNFLISYLRG